MHVAELARSKRNLLMVGGVVGVLLVVTIIAFCSLIVGRNDRYILVDEAAMQSHSTEVGLVLGSKVSDSGEPFPVLQSRLDVAADAVHAGYVKKLIVSGDNRTIGYNEPDAMKRYLVEKRGLNAAIVQPDYAGRSTYESCERLSKVFQVRRAIIYSTGSHLTRSIYLCRHFGVEAYGVASSVEPNNSGRREPLARVKAVFNAYIYGEKTVLGPVVPMH